MRSDSIRLTCCACVALVGVATPVFGQDRGTKARPSGALVSTAHPVMQVEEVVLKDRTIIFGDPSKAGAYIVRTKLAVNQTVRPGYHDKDRLITVLKGTLWFGKGDLFSPDKLMPIREGGVAYLPANTHYFQMAGEGDVILQISGNGPVRSVQSEIDAKGQPVPEGGPYPSLTAGRRRNMPIDPDLIDPDQQEQMERAAAAAKAAAAKAAEKAGAKKR